MTKHQTPNTNGPEQAFLLIFQYIWDGAVLAKFFSFFLFLFVLRITRKKEEEKKRTTPISPALLSLDRVEHK